jgi:glucose-6-phosphate 1-dehydrogenase
LLQLAALVLMEPCSDIFDFAEIPRRRLKALEALSLSGQALRGQYDGYKKEVANPASQTETFVAFQAKSSDPRWKGVPIKMATGKSLDKRLTQIKVCFKKTPSGTRNDLFFRIQPNEAIEFDLWVKEPGYERKLQKLRWNFAYDQHFSTRLPNAYEMVIVDAMRSNHSLFASSAEVIASWRILQPLLNRWQKSSADMLTYKPASSLDEILELAKEHKV